MSSLGLKILKSLMANHGRTGERPLSIAVASSTWRQVEREATGWPNQWREVPRPGSRLAIRTPWGNVWIDPRPLVPVE